METSHNGDDRQRLWNLIKDEHAAVLVTVGNDGALDARPMGCLQHSFEGTLWFMTFKNSPKLCEIAQNQHVLVSYSQPSKHMFISVSGQARTVDDRAKLKTLWTEGLRVWFPEGPGSPNLALIAVDVETAKSWTKPASFFLYAYYYVKARLTGKPPSPDQVVEYNLMRI